MGNKIILTEEQLKRISSLINEDFDSHIYDLILDKYNDVGMEGMDEDEIAYLKSGGETEIPQSLKKLKIDDDRVAKEFMKLAEAHGYKVKKFERPNDPVKITSNVFQIDMEYDEKVYSEVLRIFGGKKYIDSVNRKVLIDDFDKSSVSLLFPNRWLYLLFNEESAL
jgi:hypothetical protein